MSEEEGRVPAGQEDDHGRGDVPPDDQPKSYKGLIWGAAIFVAVVLVAMAIFIPKPKQGNQATGEPKLTQAEMIEQAAAKASDAAVAAVRDEMTNLKSDVVTATTNAVYGAANTDSLATSREVAALKDQLQASTGAIKKLTAEVRGLKTQGAPVSTARQVTVTTAVAPASPQPAPQLPMTQSSAFVASTPAASVVALSATSAETYTEGGGPHISPAEMAERATLPQLCWYEQRPDADGKLVTFTVVAAEAAQATGPGPYFMIGAGRYSWTSIESTTAQAFQQDPNGNLSKRGTFKGFQVACGDRDNPNFCPIGEEFEGRRGTMVMWEPRFRAEFVPVSQ